MQLADYKDLFIRLKDGTDITHDATSDWDLPFKKVAKCSQRPKAVADDLTNREHGQLGSRQEYPRPRLWDLTAAAFPPALQPVAQPRPPDRCFFLGSKKTRQSFIYPVHVITRNSLGLMMRKLSVTESQSSAQFRGTFSRRKPRVASANWAQVA